MAATREMGLEVNADKTKHVVMSRDQNSGRNHSVRTDNSTFERVEDFKYLETTLTLWCRNYFFSTPVYKM